ncbi:hypothetical protein MP638_004150 [Amoeboaphelidium occidentale]|nr:hypothetical protein MP638_004150 [Amoeboaphelidium occidentale]
MKKPSAKTQQKKKKEEQEYVDSSDEEFLLGSDAEGIQEMETAKIGESNEEQQEELKIHDLPAPVKPEKTSDEEKPTIVYVGRLPHGFYEDQLRGYFSQFGEITNLRVSRNKKTGRSKHYAFIEFRYPEVANIVVETMHNYLLFGRLLQCKIKVVPEGKEGKMYRMKLWKGANKKFKALNGNKRHAESFNQERSELQKELRAERLVAKERKLKRKLKELDIEYDFTGYEGCVPKKPVTAE